MFDRHGITNVKFVFTINRLSSLFHIKQRDSPLLTSMAVYLFKCSVDPNVSYVGETKRHLVRRVEGHATDSNSAINQHTRNCVQCKNNLRSNFKIIQRANTDFELVIKEALMIK